MLGLLGQTGTAYSGIVNAVEDVTCILLSHAASHMIISNVCHTACLRLSQGEKSESSLLAAARHALPQYRAMSLSLGTVTTAQWVTVLLHNATTLTYKVVLLGFNLCDHSVQAYQPGPAVELRRAGQQQRQRG